MIHAEDHQNGKIHRQGRSVEGTDDDRAAALKVVWAVVAVAVVAVEEPHQKMDLVAEVAQRQGASGVAEVEVPL